MRFAVFAAFVVVIALFAGMALLDGFIDTSITQNSDFWGIGVWVAIFGALILIGVGLASRRAQGPSASADAACLRLQGYSAVLHKLNAARKAGDAAGYATLAEGVEARAMLADGLLAGDRKAFERFIVSGKDALAGGAAGRDEAAALDELFFNLTQALQQREAALEGGAKVGEVGAMRVVG